jgi:homoserine dehydrogenase
MNNKINVGIIGLGYIGSAVYGLLESQKEYIAKKINKRIEVVKIADAQIDTIKARYPAMKGVSLCKDGFDIIRDENIDVVVELIGGIDPAYELIMEALRRGKYVVTANKDLLASRGQAIFESAAAHDVDILFEASVGGGIPIIGPLKSSLASNNIEKIVGILNGTTNYILTKMANERLSFAEALKIAQDLGYAEKANPSSDIEGFDAAYKLAILSSISFNSRVSVTDVYKEGIKDITIEDICNASDMGYAIKLLAIGTETDGKVCVRVHPTLIPKKHILSSIDDANNAIYIYGNYVGEVMSYGKGAGDRPTASSVVGDLIKIARGFDKTKKGPVYGCTCFAHKSIQSIDELFNRLYALMDVKDKPGVLAKIANVFGKNNVSIESMMQKQIDRQDSARIIFITHSVLNKNMYRSIKEIETLDVVNNVLNIIRVEDLK